MAASGHDDDLANGIQLPLDGLLFDPRELATLRIYERGQLYQQLELDPVQIAADEDAVRAVIRGDYFVTHREREGADVIGGHITWLDKFGAICREAGLSSSQTLEAFLLLPRGAQQASSDDQLRVLVDTRGTA